MKHAFLFVSLAVIAAGVYLDLFFDVPDSQVKINFFTSWVLIILGTSSFLVNLFLDNPGGKKK